MLETGGKSERTWRGFWNAIRTALKPDGCLDSAATDAGLMIPEAGARCDIASLLLGAPRYRR